jgi:hypothetical protein
MSIRQYYIDEALQSFHRQRRIIAQMTEEECLEALRLESETRRRKSVMKPLIGRAVHLRERDYSKQLKRKFRYAT